VLVCHSEDREGASQNQRLHSTDIIVISLTIHDNSALYYLFYDSSAAGTTTSDGARSGAVTGQ
jgi:hypothetical protein